LPIALLPRPLEVTQEQVGALVTSALRLPFFTVLLFFFHRFYLALGSTRMLFPSVKLCVSLLRFSPQKVRECPFPPPPPPPGSFPFPLFLVIGLVHHMFPFFPPFKEKELPPSLLMHPPGTPPPSATQGKCQSPIFPDHSSRTVVEGQPFFSFTTKC